MSERNEFSLDDDFGAETEVDVDKFIVVGDRRPKPGRKAPQAAWSKVEDVLAERRLERELKDYFDVDEA
jgi:hypothetical protein